MIVARKESGSVFGQQASISALALSLASSTSEAGLDSTVMPPPDLMVANHLDDSS